MKTQPNWKRENIPFTMLANSVAQDKTLSLKAKGLYYYLYSKPEDWQFSAYRIAKDLGCSEKTTRNLLKELEEHLLLSRQKQPNGRTIYHITYPPGNFYLKEAESQAVNFTSRQKSLPAISTAITKERDLQKKEKLQKKESANETFADINTSIELFKPVNPTYQRLFANKTERACMERLLSGGQERFEQIMQAVVYSHGKQFAPVITTPLQLERKMGELQAFIQRDGENTKTNLLII